MVIFVCSRVKGFPPFTEEKYRENLSKTVDYCKKVVAEGHTPIAPQLIFSRFMNKESDRDMCIQMGTALLDRCDEVWVFDSEGGISEGMRKDIEYASANNVPIVFK